MTVVVGFGPDTPSTSALELAAVIARTAATDVVLCCVVQEPWRGSGLPDPKGRDVTWHRQLVADAEAALIEAVTTLADDLPVTPVVRSGSSVPQTLQDEGVRREASVLVLGSAVHGQLGSIALGSTSDRLVHSAQIPVALVPRGHHVLGDRISRLVVAIDPAPTDQQLAAGTAALADRLAHLPVQIVTFAVRDGSALTSFSNQAGIWEQWVADATNAQNRLADRIADLAPSLDVTTAGVSVGRRWSRAVAGFDWNHDDLLVVGSSRHGPVARVFLGSTANRIVRSSPVPVMLLPRD